MDQTSTEATDLLVQSLLSHSPLDYDAHVGCVQAADNAARKERVAAGTMVVESVAHQQGHKVRKRLEQMKETGAWLTAIPDRFSGTVLPYQA